MILKLNVFNVEFLRNNSTKAMDRYTDMEMPTCRKKNLEVAAGTYDMEIEYIFQQFT